MSYDWHHEDEEYTDVDPAKLSRRETIQIWFAVLTLLVIGVIVGFLMCLIFIKTPESNEPPQPAFPTSQWWESQA